MSNTNGSSHESTPPSGIDLAALRSLEPSEAVVYLAEQIRELREAEQRTYGIAGRAVAQAILSAQSSDRARDAAESAVAAIALLRADTHAAIDDLSGRVIVAFGAQSTSIAALRAAIGEAPRHLDPRESKTGEHTPAELVAMESGTGLAGIVGRMRAEQSRAARKQALGVASVAALVPVIAELVKALL